MFTSIKAFKITKLTYMFPLRLEKLIFKYIFSKVFPHTHYLVNHCHQFSSPTTILIFFFLLFFCVKNYACIYSALGEVFCADVQCHRLANSPIAEGSCGNFSFKARLSVVCRELDFSAERWFHRKGGSR